MKTKLFQTLHNEQWKDLLSEEFDKAYFQKLLIYLESEYSHCTVYPNEQDVFSIFNACNPEKLKVVILGQDPYHNEFQANGMAFSVQQGVKIPPSLRNIIKELKTDINIAEPMHGDLTNWAKQGVFLLNTCLTVRAHEPLSHQNKGWEKFTGRIIEILNESQKGIVFILWGKKAHEKAQLINKNHYILKSHHPSPLSAYRGFFGCKHFSKTNEFLTLAGKEPINWEII